MSSVDLLTLRSRVAAALSGQIGTLVYSNGIEVPALRVDDGVDVDYGEMPQVNGLEVVIQPYTTMALQAYFGDGASLDDIYEIRLKQRDSTKTVQSLIPRLFLALQDVLLGNPVYLPRNARLDSLDQAIFFVPYQRI